MNTVIVIPARMASTRLPGKPLADIAGKSLLGRMVEIGLKARLGPVLAAVAEPELAQEADRFGARAILTDPDLPSGTDRVHAAVMAAIAAGDSAPDIVINLQGDMPTIAPDALALCAALLRDTDADIATLASPSEDPADRDNPNVVKAILARRTADPAMRALYFTRAAAPSGPGPIWRHVGLYAYRFAALKAFVAAPPSALEVREKLEQLRALEMGLTIAAGLVADFPKGVDTPADLEAARAALAGR